MEIWLLTDSHLGHGNIIKFGPPEGGTPYRHRPDGAAFGSVEEHDDLVVSQWAKLVKPGDTVFHLGDFTWSLAAHAATVAKKLPGKKLLIKGNHDKFPVNAYYPYFNDILATKILDGLVLSHIPLHRNEFAERFKANVHGHIHHFDAAGPEYLNICPEKVGFAPLTLGQVKEMVTRTVGLEAAIS